MPDYSSWNNVHPVSMRVPAESWMCRIGPALTAERALSWCGVLLGLEVVTLLVVVAGTHGLLTHGMPPTTTDFSSFYAAGHLADLGHPALAYNQAAHYEAEQQATSRGVIYSYFYYPPIFLLVCSLFGRLPYLAAFMLFQLTSLWLYLCTAVRVMARRTWLAAIPVLAFPANFWNFGLGQNGFLTAGLFGGATLLLERRPALAGILFGAISIKPHFGLLVPVALIAGRHWRAFAAAALTVAGLAALSALCFGVETWRAFIGSFASSPRIYQSGTIGFELMVSVFGAMRLLGCSAAVAYALQGVATAGSMLAVGLVWRRRLALPIRAATLLAATVTAVPLILFYDLTIVGMALAWLARPAGRPMSMVERLAVGLVFALVLAVRSVTWTMRTPVGLIAACIVLAMALHRAALEAGWTVPGRRTRIALG